MKKIIAYIFGISLIAFTFTNCKSTKSGCGLTSDAHKIEQTTSANNTILAAEVY